MPTKTKQPALTFSIRGISVDRGDALILHDINWQVRRGENWAVVGANGSGKSTLAAAIAGDIATSGEIDYFFEEDGDPCTRIASVSFRLHRQFVAQADGYYQSRWFVGEEEATLTARQILQATSKTGVQPVAEKMGITRLLDRQSLHLSTGEMRRLLIARALLMKPVLLLLDEPFIGLDAAGRSGLAKILDRLMREGQQIIFLTARPWELPRRIARRLYLSDGAQVPERKATRLLTLKKLPVVPSRGRIVAKNVIELRDVTLSAGDVVILDRFDWTVRAGEHWAVVGPNGSGKTTLLSLLNGDHPQAFAQDVRLFGKPRSEYGLFELKAKVGWASPDIALHYDTQTSGFEFVCTGFFETLGLYNKASRSQQAQAREWIRYFGLDAVADVPFRALSDGQQRLAFLARAMVKRRELLILDEPCQGLDRVSRALALNAIDRICCRGDTTLVIVTHYADELPPCITDQLKLHRKS